jgi:hypothetical protein
MPKFKVTAPDGTASVEEAPTQQAAITLAQQKRAAASNAAGSSRAPAVSPAAETPERDIVGRAKEWLTREPPEGSEIIIGGVNPFRWARAAEDIMLPESIPGAAAFAATLPFGGAAPMGAARAAMQPAKRIAADLFSGGLVTGPLKRTAASALAAGTAGLAQGQNLASAGWEGGRTALSQLAGEVFPGMLKFGLTQKAGQRALGERAAEIGQREISQGAAAKVREDKIAHDTAMEKSVSQLEKENYAAEVAARQNTEATAFREARAQHQETVATSKRNYAAAEEARQAQHRAAVEAATARHAADVRAYEQSGAQIIAGGFKQQVPALSGFPSTEAGLLNMVSGEGPQRVSAKFDEAMKGIIASGKDKLVQIPHQDAKALGLEGIRTMKGEGGRVIAIVNAGQLAEKATGYWKKDHGVYRRAVAALDKADLGDPASRAEYRAFRALADFAESSQMLKGKKFNPDLARAAFDRVKKLDMLRRRGQGDMFTGPVAQAVNRPTPTLRLPAASAPLGEPLIPPFRRPAPPPEVTPPAKRAIVAPPKLETPTPLSPTPEGVTTKTLPRMSLWQGAFVGELPYLIGAVATGQHGYGGPGVQGLGIAGGLAAAGLSGRTFVTRAPLSGASELATRVLPGFEAQEARRLMGQP